MEIYYVIYVGGRQDPIKVTETHDPLPPSPDSLHQAAEWQHLSIKQGFYNSAVSKRKHPRPATTNTTAHMVCYQTPVIYI